MATIRENLEQRFREELQTHLRTPVTKQEMDHIVGCLSQRTKQWLRDTYEEHSAEYQVYGEPAAQVARPSFEWLCESMDV